MLTKSGDVCYRSRSSRCQKCKYYIKDYICWYESYIQYMKWENCVGYECKYFDSALKKQINSHFVFRDFEDKKLFPDKVFGQGKYRFNARGERI